VALDVAGHEPKLGAFSQTGGPPELHLKASLQSGLGESPYSQ